MSRTEEVQRDADQVLEALRKAINAILPATAAWPAASPFELLGESDKRSGIINAALLELGKDVAQFNGNRGCYVVSAAVGKVVVERGPRAETVIPRNKLHVRRSFFRKEDGIEIRCDARKEE